MPSFRTYRYQAYQLLIDSELELPNLRVGGEGNPDVWIRREPLPSLSATLPWSAGPSEFSIELGGYARYRVRQGKEILVDALQEPEQCPEIAVFLQDTPLAALLMQRGLLPLHASAVDLSRPPHGRISHRFQMQYPEAAALLIGPWGSGKSTLATMLDLKGFPVISDDMAALRLTDGEVEVIPSVPELRLWRHTLHILGEQPEQFSPEVNTLKGKYWVEPQVWGAECRPVRALLFLAGKVEPEELIPVDAAEARQYLLRSIYRWRLWVQMGYDESHIFTLVDTLARRSRAFAVRDCAAQSHQGPWQWADRFLKALSAPQSGSNTRLEEYSQPATTSFRELEAPPKTDGSHPGYTLLASYPKSGNTWVRAMLERWSSQGKSPLVLEGLGSGHPILLRHHFEEVLQVDPAVLNLEETRTWRARLHRARQLHFSHDTLPIKTHDAFFQGQHNEQVFPEDTLASVVYVVRCPLDLVLSWANYFAVTVEGAVENLNDRQRYLHGDLSGTSPFLPQYCGTWSDHVRGWLTLPKASLLLVRYEDLLEDALTEVSRIWDFLGLKATQRELKGIIRETSFKKMQRQERTHGFPERPSNCPIFFRKGQSGEWRQALPPELARRICEDHGEVMRLVGYGAEVDEVLGRH